MESVRAAAAGLNFSNKTADCLCLPSPGLYPLPSSPLPPPTPPHLRPVIRD